MGFLRKTVQAWLASVTSEAWNRFPPESQERKRLSDIHNNLLNFHELHALGLLHEPPPGLSISGEVHQDFLQFNNGWDGLVHEDLARLGEHGPEAASSVAEVLLKSYAIARRIGGSPILYRGESSYGWKLLSRVGRRGGTEPAWGSISAEEISELDRFQRAVEADPDLQADIAADGSLPSSPMGWLAAMQHYDDYGTRMLDVTSSVFAALYFACISWDGVIDDGVDGRLYVFSPKGARRDYVPRPAWTRWDEAEQGMSLDIQPDRIEEMFKLKYPHVYRVVLSPDRNERMLAQDGLFILPAEPGTSWGQHFEIRIPASTKLSIVAELWQAGYTPERIVRGSRGRDAHGTVWQSVRPVVA